jgi:hypothetical protein
MNYKISKYLYKIDKSLKTKNYNKTKSYCNNLKYHNNLIGGNNNKILELEQLLDNILKQPKFGINDLIEQNFKNTYTEFKKYDELITEKYNELLTSIGVSKITT